MRNYSSVDFLFSFSFRLGHDGIRRYCIGRPPVPQRPLVRGSDHQRTRSCGKSKSFFFFFQTFSFSFSLNWFNGGKLDVRSSCVDDFPWAPFLSLAHCFSSVCVCLCWWWSNKGPNEGCLMTHTRQYSAMPSAGLKAKKRSEKAAKHISNANSPFCALVRSCRQCNVKNWNIFNELSGPFFFFGSVFLLCTLIEPPKKLKKMRSLATFPTVLFFFLLDAPSVSYFLLMKWA